MPFKSEKQRRFMWAEHPEIAKRWAHKYPESNKGLPMYADDKTDKDEKKAALQALTNALTLCGISKSSLETPGVGRETKVAADGLMYVDIPRSDKPTYAGQQEVELEEKSDENADSCAKSKTENGDTVEKIFGKLAAVLARPLREMMEHRQALEEGRDPRFVPENMNIKRVAVPSPMIAPPMGMATPPGAPASAPAVPQPGNSQQNTPVGGGSNPQHNPIQAFGPLGAKGQLNGNAAFGQKNSPDSLKTAALAVLEKLAGSSPAWQRSEGKNPEGGLNAKGRASYKRETGGTLKAPVTESKPTGERAKRQNSFCSRMCGMKRVNTGAKTKSDPDSRINKSLRKWNCKCGSALDLAIIAELEKTAGLFSTISNVMRGKIVPAAASAAQTAARKVPQLSLEAASPAVLPALAAARKTVIPASRVADVAEFAFKRVPKPILPPASRMRMPNGVNLNRRFGDTEAARAALSAAMERFHSVGQAAGRIPVNHGSGAYTSFFGDLPTKATTWGQLQKIVPGAGKLAR